jgi:hypothetical protein
MLQAVFELLIVGTCAAIGEIVLWAVTFGHRKPFQANKHGELSTLIGALFWFLIAVGVTLALVL